MVLAMRSLSWAIVASSPGNFSSSLPGQPAGRIGGVIGRGPDLPHQREHVGREPHAQKVRLVDLAGRGMGRRLVEHAGQAAEMLDEHRNRNGVHGNGHGMRLLIG